MKRAALFILLGGIAALFSSASFADNVWKDTYHTPIFYGSATAAASSAVSGAVYSWEGATCGADWATQGQPAPGSGKTIFKRYGGWATCTDTRSSGTYLISWHGTSCPNTGDIIGASGACEPAPVIDCSAKTPVAHKWQFQYPAGWNTGGFQGNFQDLGGPEYISDGECEFKVDYSHSADQGNGCYVSAANPEITYCVDTYSPTGVQAGASQNNPSPAVDPGTPDPDTSGRPSDSTSTETDPPIVQNDTPNPGDTTTIENDTTSEQAPGFTTVTKLDDVDIIRLTGGTLVTRIKTKTTIDYGNGTKEERTDTTYTRAPQPYTETRLDHGTGGVSATGQEKPGGTTGTQEVTITNPDGSKSTTITNNYGGGGSGESPSEQGEMPSGDDVAGYTDGLFDAVDGNQDTLENTEGMDVGTYTWSNPLRISGGSCQSVTTSFLGRTFTFPGTDGCQRLETLKEILAYFLYVMTAIYLFKLASKPL